MRAMHNVLGGVLDPHAAWLLLRGMKTLGVRVRQQNATAHTIARRCAPHKPGNGVLLRILCDCGNSEMMYSLMPPAPAAGLGC